MAHKIGDFILGILNRFIEKLQQIGEESFAKKDAELRDKMLVSELGLQKQDTIAKFIVWAIIIIGIIIICFF